MFQKNVIDITSQKSIAQYICSSQFVAVSKFETLIGEAWGSIFGNKKDPAWMQHEPFNNLCASPYREIA